MTNGLAHTFTWWLSASVLSGWLASDTNVSTLAIPEWDSEKKVIPMNSISFSASFSSSPHLLPNASHFSPLEKLLTCATEDKKHVP